MQRKRLPWTRLFAAVADAVHEKELGSFDKSKASLYVQTNDGAPRQVAALAVQAQLPDFEVEPLLTELDFESDVDVEAKSAKLYDDSWEALRRLRDKGLKLALVSNLATPYACALDLCGIRSFFHELVFSFAEGAAKGQPGDQRIYHAASSRLGVPPQECLFVGDTVAADFDGPVSAGMRAVHLDRRVRKESDRRAAASRPTISSLAELFPDCGGAP